MNIILGDFAPARYRFRICSNVWLSRRLDVKWSSSVLREELAQNNWRSLTKDARKTDDRLCRYPTLGTWSRGGRDDASHSIPNDSLPAIRNARYYMHYLNYVI